MDDRQVVAAIAAGDPAGLANAYDEYAAPLYGYCRWMLHDPGDAAGALRHTFVIAATKLGGLPDPRQLRPWLYAVARRECHRRLRTAGQSPVALSAAVLSSPADVAGQPATASHDAELRRLIRATVDGLKAGDREVIELSLGHDLSDSDLAVVLGLPGSRAHALASRARGQLEEALGMLLIARTGRKACPVLDELLAGWDGRLTSQTHGLVSRHVKQCQACAGHRRGALRPQALSGMLPLAPLPVGLREQVLGRCTCLPRDPEPARLAGRGRIRRNPGIVTAAAAVIMWAVAAVTAILITVTGSHPARAQAVRTGAGSSASRTEQARRPPSSARTSSPTHSPSPSLLPKPSPSPSPFR